MVKAASASAGVNHKANADKYLDPSSACVLGVVDDEAVPDDDPRQINLSLERC